MIAIDTNLLVFAHRGDASHHERVMEALTPIFEAAAPWAIPWPCVHEFLAISTNSRIYKPASTLDQALAFMKSLLDSPGCHVLSEGPSHFEKLAEITRAGRVSGARIHDARIAAICLQHGVRELWSADRDFSSFPQLKVRNPLIDI